jgi:hypothetical protein
MDNDNLMTFAACERKSCYILKRWHFIKVMFLIFWKRSKMFLNMADIYVTACDTMVNYKTFCEEIHWKSHFVFMISQNIKDFEIFLLFWMRFGNINSLMTIICNFRQYAPLKTSYIVLNCESSQISQTFFNPFQKENICNLLCVNLS